MTIHSTHKGNAHGNRPSNPRARGTTDRAREGNGGAGHARHAASSTAAATAAGRRTFTARTSCRERGRPAFGAVADCAPRCGCVRASVATTRSRLLHHAAQRPATSSTPSDMCTLPVWSGGVGAVGAAASSIRRLSRAASRFSTAGGGTSWPTTSILFARHAANVSGCSDMGALRRSWGRSLLSGNCPRQLVQLERVIRARRCAATLPSRQPRLRDACTAGNLGLRKSCCTQALKDLEGSAHALDYAYLPNSSPHKCISRSCIVPPWN